MRVTAIFSDRFSANFPILFAKMTQTESKTADQKIRSLFAVLKGIESLAHYLPHISTMTNAVGSMSSTIFFKAENLVLPQRT